MSEKYPVDVLICRSSDGTMHLTIQDKKSRIEFVSVVLSLSEFAKAVTASPGAGEAEYRGVEHIGKDKIREPRTAVYPGHPFDDRDIMRAWLEKHRQEAGWTLDSYLGSQSSITSKSDPSGKPIITLHYAVMKWV